MKIPVQEIEGEYYCAVDNIAKVKKAKNGLFEAIKINRKNAVFLVLNEVNALFFNQDGEKQSIKANIPFRITLLSKGETHGVPMLIYSLFCSLFCSLFVEPPIRFKYEAKVAAHDPWLFLSNIKAFFSLLIISAVVFWVLYFLWYEIIEKYYLPPKGIAIKELEGQKIFGNNGDKMVLDLWSAQGLFVLLSDAKIYLADCTSDDDFIMPNTLQAERVEQIIKQPIELTDDNPLGEKERANLHRVIHAMKEVLLAENNKEDRLFKSQNELIAHLVSTYKGYSGLSESQLKQLCAKLNQQFNEAEKTFKNSL